MKKRVKYERNPFGFHREVVERKHLTRREKDSLVRRKVRRRFGLYKKMMAADNLEDLRNHHLRMPDYKAESLKGLYSYKALKFKELKKELTTAPKNRIDNVCPYCQLDKVGTLDHILPKTPFPEYSSMPWNLIPCCSTCNSKKDDVWLDAGNKRCFINFYIDDIPAVQYFFANVSVVNDSINVGFELRFPLGYDSIMKARIENHYTKLGLIKRYLENSDDVITELEETISTSAPGLTEAEIIKSIIDKCNKEQTRMGVNYWQAVLKIACVSNPSVYALLK